MVRNLFSKSNNVTTPPVEHFEPVRTTIKTDKVIESKVEEPFQIRLPIRNEEQYLSVAAVAKLLQVEKPTVYRYIYAKKLKDIAIGGKRKIAKSEVERFANSYNQGERLRRVKR